MTKKKSNIPACLSLTGALNLTLPLAGEIFTAFATRTSANSGKNKPLAYQVARNSALRMGSGSALMIAGGLLAKYFGNNEIFSMGNFSDHVSDFLDQHIGIDDGNVLFAAIAIIVLPIAIRALTAYTEVKSQLDQIPEKKVEPQPKPSLSKLEEYPKGEYHTIPKSQPKPSLSKLLKEALMYGFFGNTQIEHRSVFEFESESESEPESGPETGDVRSKQSTHLIEQGSHNSNSGVSQLLG